MADMMWLQRRPARWRIGVALAVTAVVVGAAAIAAFSAGGALSGDKVPANPDAGLTDAQRLEKIATARAGFETRYAQWIADLDVSSLDLRALPHGAMLADYLAPEGHSLQSSAKVADVVVTGTVSTLRALVSGSSAAIDVESVLKGAVPSTIEVGQAGGPAPTLDWKGVVIADAANAPTLLPGDRVALLLHREADGGYWPESFTGIYYLEDGGVRALPGNPFAGTVNSMAEADFVDSLRAAAAP